MTKSAQQFILSLLFAFMLVVSSHAQLAKTPAAFKVADNAGMFTDNEKEKANAEIARIKLRTGKDLLLETFKSAPDTIKKIDLKDKNAKSKFFTDWAMDRAKNSKVNGIYVLISTDPKYVRVLVGKKTLNKGLFTAAHRNELGKLLRTKLGQKKPDDALASAVAYVAEKLPPKSPPKSSPAPKKRKTDSVGAQTGMGLLGWICLGLVVVLVVWMVIGVVRAFSGGGGARGTGDGGGGGGGSGFGGFFPSLLGGLFGAAAGMWLYNQFASPSNAASSAAPSPTEPLPDQPASQDDHEDDYYADEGDGSYEPDRFDGGGDDFGGGDFGGDDLGGGEW